MQTASVPLHVQASQATKDIQRPTNTDFMGFQNVNKSLSTPIAMSLLCNYYSGTWSSNMVIKSPCYCQVSSFPFTELILRIYLFCIRHRGGMPMFQYCSLCFVAYSWPYPTTWAAKAAILPSCGQYWMFLSLYLVFFVDP